MHTTEWHGKRSRKTLGDEEVEIYFHHNGDYSGDVIINVVPGDIPDDAKTEELIVPFKALAELVGRAVLSNKIRELEDLSGVEVLEL